MIEVVAVLMFVGLACGALWLLDKVAGSGVVPSEPARRGLPPARVRPRRSRWHVIGEGMRDGWEHHGARQTWK